MSSVNAMYRSLEDLTRRFEVLHRKFGEFFDAAQHLAEENNFGPNIKFGNHPEKNYFTVDLLDKRLDFRFSSALSETNSPVGIVSCLETNLDDKSKPKVVANISFSTSGKISGIAKPDDVEDPLVISDAVSAMYVVSFCIYLTLRNKAQA